MITYEQLLARPERTDVFIVILAPKEPNDPVVDPFTWTLDADDTYYTDYPRNADEHWYVWECYEDGQKLNPRTSLASCKATSASWYFDKATRRVYVHMVGDDDPVDHKVQVCPLLAFCSETHPKKEFTILEIPSTVNDGLGYANVLFYPLLSDKGLSKVSARLDSAFQGVSLPAVSDLEFSNEPLINGDVNGMFDKWGRRFLWRDTMAFIWHGDGGYELEFDEFRSLGRHTIKASPMIDDQTFKLQLQSDAASFQKMLPTARYTDEDAAGDDVAGQFKPILLGGHNDMPAFRESSTVFMLADHAIEAITDVKVNGVAKTGGGVDYTASLSTGKITFTATVEAGAVVTWSGQAYWKMDGTLGAAAQYAGAAVNRILNTYAKVKAWKINTTELAAYDAAYPVPISIYIGGAIGQKSIRDVLEILMTSVIARLVQDEDGKYTLTKFDPAAASIVTILADQIRSIKEYGEGMQIANEIMLKYFYIFTTQEFHVKRKESLLAGTNYEGTNTQEIKAEYLIEPTHADNAAADYLLIHEDDPQLIEVEAMGEAFAVQVGDKVTISRPRGREFSGAYAGDYLVRSFEKDTSQAPGLVKLMLETVTENLSSNWILDLTS